MRRVSFLCLVVGCQPGRERVAQGLVAWVWTVLEGWDVEVEFFFPGAVDGVGVGGIWLVGG